MWLKAVATIALLVLLGRVTFGPAAHGHDEPPGLWAAWSSWALMSAAMMLPPLAPVACRVAASGLWTRRRRSVAEFAGAHLAVWWVVGGAAALLVQQTLDGRHGSGGYSTAVAATLGLAAVWHRLPARRRLLRRCGSFRPIALDGRAATVDCVRAGGWTGLRSLAGCGPAMTPMWFTHDLLLMAALTGLLWSERARGPNPSERVAHPAQAFGLLALSFVSLATG